MQFLGSLWFAVWLLNTESRFIAGGLMFVGFGLAAGDGFRLRLHSQIKGWGCSAWGAELDPLHPPAALPASAGTAMAPRLPRGTG